MAFTRVAALLHAALSDVSANQHHVPTVETVHPAPSIDNEIARYDGIAGAIQGYTSLGPTFTDDGILIIPAGSIDFPDVQIVDGDANRLDDYEVGTFTPTIQDSSRSNSESQAYANQIGRYQKVGNRVSFQILITSSSIGTLTGGDGIVIAGLPFTSNSVNSNRPAVAIARGKGLAITGGQSVSGFVLQNDTVIILELFDDAAGTTDMTVTEWSANGELSLMGSYEV